MLKTIPLLLLTTGLSIISAVTHADTEAVINLNVKHTVGGIEKFDRKKFITLHSDLTENDWNGDEDKLEYMMNDLDVYMGRNNGTLPFNFNQAKEDANRSGFADPADIVIRGVAAKKSYAENFTSRHQYDDKSEMMIGGQVHPFYGNKTTKPFNGSEGWEIGDGDAVGEYMGRFINEFYRNENESITEGQARPKYLEVLNEPLFELITEGDQQPIDVFNFHNDVAKSFRQFNQDVLIGGYTTAFPIFEENNFQRWEDRMKLFIDTSGEFMDFYSIHFYDLRVSNSNNKGPNYFKGGRVEATMDMMDSYTLATQGETKPFFISEFGGRDRSVENKPWTPFRDWQTIKAVSPMMLSFMDRPNTILKTIPFTLVKAEFALTNTNSIPYNWRLLRQRKEDPAFQGSNGDEYVFTDMVKIFELWSDVNGTRVDTTSTNPSVMVDSYVNGTKAYIILSNLTKNREKTILHKFGANAENIVGVKVKHLYLSGNTPVLDVTNESVEFDRITIEPEATAIIEYTFNSDIEINATSNEIKYFAADILTEIKANTAHRFKFDGVSKNEFGEAVLRLAIGRDNGTSRAPKIVFNGTELESSARISGDDQINRDRFFGLLEFNVPNTLLKATNEVDVTFVDDGGHISSVSMQVFSFSTDIRPNEGPVTGINISPESAILAIGDTLQLSASTLPFFANNRNLIFSSSAAEIATVDQNGLVRALTIGEVILTATAEEGNFTATSTVTIEEPVTASIALNDRNIYTTTAYKSGDVIDVTVNYEAGTGFEITDGFGGIEYFLRHLKSGFGLAGPDIIVRDPSAIGQQRGTSTVQIPLVDLTPSADLAEGEFYFLFARLNSSSGVGSNVSVFPITIEQGDVQSVEPGLIFDDAAQYRNTVYTTNNTLDVSVQFEAGENNTVNEEFGGVQFFLRELDANFSLVNDIILNDNSAVGTQSGTAKASFSLNGLTPSSELEDGHFYFLLGAFQGTDGTEYFTQGVFPITVEQGVVEPSFEFDDINTYRNTEYLVGDDLNVTTSFEVGTGNTVTNETGGIRYFLHHLKADFSVVKDIIIDDENAIGQQSGTSSVNFSLSGVTPTTELPEGHFYFLFALMQSSDGNAQNVSVARLNIANLKGDWDGDADVDISDIRGVIRAIQRRENISLSFDFNADGVVNILDVRGMSPLCTRNRCAP